MLGLVEQFAAHYSSAANPLWKMMLAQLAVTQCPDQFPLSATFSSILDFGRDAIVRSPIWNVASAGGL